MLGILLNILAALALCFMLLGAAGPATDAQYIEHIGQGAQLVLVIDRCASMDEG